eukprot:SAG22_NODE_2254_length_2781_cov_2.255034_2_plen_92_part_00
MEKEEEEEEEDGGRNRQWNSRRFLSSRIKAITAFKTLTSCHQVRSPPARPPAQSVGSLDTFVIQTADHFEAVAAACIDPETPIGANGSSRA